MWNRHGIVETYVAAACIGMLIFNCDITVGEQSVRGLKILAPDGRVEIGPNADISVARDGGDMIVSAANRIKLNGDIFVGSMPLSAYIVEQVKKSIIPHIDSCEAGWAGPFCDTPAQCNIENSNMVAGPDCGCKDGYSGTIRWTGSRASGFCRLKIDDQPQRPERIPAPNGIGREPKFDNFGGKIPSPKSQNKQPSGNFPGKFAPTPSGTGSEPGTITFQNTIPAPNQGSKTPTIDQKEIKTFPTPSKIGGRVPAIIK